MTQNLVISNDKDSEHVQFSVIIPDGYSSFSIDSINGTLINQNFLKTGDKLQFSFSNNPYVYYDASNPDKYALDTYLLPGTNWRDRNQIKKHFKGFEADLLKFYRVQYLPVFYYYQRIPSRYIYIFNPCDKNFIKDEPEETINNPIIEIYGGGTNQTPQYATFTGHYIIALKPVSKIDDITLTIGESIDNSKTRLQEMGAHQETDTIQRFIDTNYTYATNWRYNVSNLLMNHVPYFINVITTNFYSRVLNLIHYNLNGREILITNSREFNNEPLMTPATETINNLIYDFYYYHNSNWEALDTKIYYNLTYDNVDLDVTGESNSQLPLITFIDTSLGFYYTLQPDNIPLTNAPSFVSPLAIRDGENVSDHVYIVTNTDIDNWEEKPITDLVYIKTDAFYSFHWKNVIVEIQDEAELAYWDEHHAEGDIITFGSSIAYPYHSDTICSPDSYYYTSTQETHTGFNIKMYELSNNGEKLNNANSLFVLAGDIKLDNDGGFYYADGIYPGYDITNNVPSFRKINNSPNKTFPLQLTQNDNNNDNVKHAIDDLLINKIDNDKFKLSMPELNNNYYVIKEVGNKAQTNIYEQEWDNTVKPLVFLPHRFNQLLKPFKTSFTRVNKGFYIVNNINNEPAEDIDETEFEYFLAEGHDSLIVQKQTNEDLNYKTFNGSLLFDRTSSKITRIMSNDVTGSCLGYLNDLLSARLSRYYFVSNYETFNISTNENVNLYLTNAKNSNKYLFENKTLIGGNHDIVLCSAFDIVKLVGSENVLNNITPSLTTELQTINSLGYTYSKITDPNEDLNDDLKQFYYKTFHYYSSSIFNYPYLGFSLIDNLNNEATIGGKSLNYILESLFTQSLPTNCWDIVNSHEKLYFITNKSKVPDKTTQARTDLINDIKTNHLNHDTNKNVNLGVIEKLPTARIYRNSNFEQTDLTISTGGIKTLHPIYIQSTNRKVLNNVLFMLDSVINQQIKQYNQLYTTNENNDMLSFFGVLGVRGLNDLTTTSKPILRFCKSKHYTRNKTSYDSASFDTSFILDFLTMPSVAEQNVDSIPDRTNQTTTNTETIYEFKTDSQLTNIQLFSERHFDMFDNINFLSVGEYRQTYNDAFSSVSEYIKNYISGNEEQTSYLDGIYSIINGYNSFNQLKTYRMFFAKLGEFLQYPKLIYGTANAFKNAHNVFIMFVNTELIQPETVNSPVKGRSIEQPTIYETVTNPDYDPKHKANVSMVGCVFRYHQQALGWQQMSNDLNENEFNVSRGEGNKHFIIILNDEYGRLIPNIDTSQGFNNNLKLELTLR